MPVSAPTVLPPVTDPSTAWLVVDDIALRYGKRTILEHLSFALPQGGIACLLGPSGCGKTTALRAIAGFEPISDGAIRLAGQVLSAPGQITPPEKRRIGMVFQDYALFPHLTVAQNVGFGLRGRAGADQRVAEMLDTVGLAHAAQRFPHELSGGQQQRVALARALAPQPSILLLDEPFSNLDVALRERLAGEVRDILKATNTTAVLVTHDQHEAFAMADVIGVMADGHLQQWDTAYGLYHQPANRRVANFVGQGAFVPAVVVDEHHLRLVALGQRALQVLVGVAADLVRARQGRVALFQCVDFLLLCLQLCGRGLIGVAPGDGLPCAPQAEPQGQQQHDYGRDQPATRHGRQWWQVMVRGRRRGYLCHASG